MGNKNIWIGARRSSDKWIQTEGETFDDTAGNWANNEPGSDTSMACAYAEDSQGFKLKDDCCDEDERSYFVCQFNSYT